MVKFELVSFVKMFTPLLEQKSLSLSVSDDLIDVKNLVWEPTVKAHIYVSSEKIKDTRVELALFFIECWQDICCWVSNYF